MTAPDQFAPLDALAEKWAEYYPDIFAYRELRAAIAEARALAPEQSTDPNGATNDDSWSDEDDPLCVCGRSDRGRDGHEFGPGCDSWEPDLYDPTPATARALAPETVETVIQWGTRKPGSSHTVHCVSERRARQLAEAFDRAVVSRTFITSRTVTEWTEVPGG